jgi:hypothetical protein
MGNYRFGYVKGGIYVVVNRRTLRRKSAPEEGPQERV